MLVVVCCLLWLLSFLYFSLVVALLLAPAVVLILLFPCAPAVLFWGGRTRNARGYRYTPKTILSKIGYHPKI